MTESYDVAVKVVSRKGVCHAGHKVGDEWVLRINEYKTPEGICLAAFGTLFPFITSLMFGGLFPWEESDPSVTQMACVDSVNTTVFEIRRLPKE